MPHKPMTERRQGRRITKTASDQRAGCTVCHGYEAHWLGANAQAIAARHTDATGHETWVEASLSISYSRKDEGE